MKYILNERFVLNEADNEESADLNSEEKEASQSKDQSANQNNEPNNAGAKDDSWEDRYEACKSAEEFKKFWLGNNDPAEKDEKKKLGYWRAEWKNQAKKVQEFQQVLCPNLVADGWTAKENPVISFLNTPKILENLSLSIFLILMENYNINGGKALSAKDLRGTGKLGKENLIFDSALYELPSYQVAEYLTLQHKAISSGKVDVNTFKSIFLSNGKLNSQEKIKRNLRAHGVAEAKVVSDKDADELLKQINQPEEAKKVLAVLYLIYKTTNPKAFAKIKGLDEALKGYSLEVLTVDSILKRFKLTDSKYMDNTANKLLKGLITKATGKDYNTEETS